MQKTDEASLIEKIETMIFKLGRYFSIETDTDASKALTLKELWTKLTAKTLKKNCTPLFIIAEV